MASTMISFRKARTAAAIALAAALAGGALAAPALPKPELVTVKRGEHLTLLARRHGTTVPKLVALNNLKTTVLRVGQTIRLRPAPRSIVLERRKVLGVPVSVVRVDLNDRGILVTPRLPARGIGFGAKLDVLANGSSAIAMINGGYFHPTSFHPAGDLVVRGQLVSTGKVRTALTITPDNRAVIRPAPMNSPVSWRGYDTVVANGPYILRRGQVAVYPQAEGYKDPAIWSRAARSAVGVVSERKIFLVSTTAKLTLSELAKVMRALGARDGITLDGGSSVGMAWKGKVLIRPARRLAYSIAVYENNPWKK